LLKVQELITSLIEDIINAKDETEINKIRKRLNYYINKIKKELKKREISEKDIEDYIEKSFGKKVVENLKNFFDDFFSKFSKYFVLAEKCELFIDDFFNEKYEGNLNEELAKEKKDVALVKNNFSVVFKNFMYFLRLISKNNLGMVYHIILYNIS
jgi:hypothetical protein